MKKEMELSVRTIFHQFTLSSVACNKLEDSGRKCQWSTKGYYQIM